MIKMYKTKLHWIPWLPFKHLNLLLCAFVSFAVTQGISGSGMDKATKQYRQYIFKVNHKLSRKAAKMGDATVADNPKVRGMLRAASKVIQASCCILLGILLQEGT